MSDIYQFYTQRHSMEPRVEGVEQMISSIFSRGSGANRVTGSSSLGMSLMAVVLGAVGASLLQQLDLHKTTTTGTRC